jgi:hypothetical protein
MTIPPFSPGYPPNGSSLGETKVEIRDNLDGTYQVFSVDHINQNDPLNTGNPGAHQQAQLYEVPGILPPQPPIILKNGFETLYAQVTNQSSPLIGDGLGNIFFTRGSSGFGIQLTGPKTPGWNTTNGYTFLPGGFAINVGIGTFDGTTPVVITFKTSPNKIFLNKIFGIFVQPITSNVDYNIVPTLPPNPNQGFTIAATDTSVAQFYWLAIGM